MINSQRYTTNLKVLNLCLNFGLNYKEFLLGIELLLLY